MNKLSIVFFGTPDFSVPTLRALVAAGHNIVSVYTQPPRPSGRGQKIHKSPIHIVADQNSIDVRTPSSLRSEDQINQLTKLRADVCVVVAYGKILPKQFLSIPRLGCINLHASLLPRWRGAAPIQHAILAGDSVHGFTLMQLDEGLDTGPIIKQYNVNVGERPNAGILHDTIASSGAKELTEILAECDNGLPPLELQPKIGETHAPKITTSDTKINWKEDSTLIDRIIRAFSPYPGAWFIVSGERIRVLEAEPVNAVAPPGIVLDPLIIACGSGAIKINSLQREGRKPMTTEMFLRGFPIATGTNLNSGLV